MDAPPLRSNPFATRSIRPGRIPFLFPAGQQLTALLDRLRGGGWWGQIVGPHGSGKSTLLAALLPALRAAGRQVVLLELHDGQRRLPADVWRQPRFSAATQLVIDGYEQLSRWQRLRIKRRCRLAGCGLLVTSHAPLGLPDVYCTRPDLETALRVVQALLADEPGAIGADEIERSFLAHHGNLREMLFTLYDVYERRR